MFWSALVAAWNHKELWPFAVLAGFAGTGVVVNDLVQQASFALTPGATLTTFFGGNALSFVLSYLRLIIVSGPHHLVQSILGIVALLCGTMFIIVLCQQLVLASMHRVAHQKKRLTGRDLLRALHHHHFLRILGVDLLFHMVIFLVLGGCGVLLRALPLSSVSGGAVALLLIAATLFVTFVLNVILMLTLVAVGENHVPIIDGIQEGILRFMRHPLVATEVALLVFAANFALTMGYLLGLVILSIPIGLLFAEAFSKAMAGMMIAVAFFGALLVVMFTVLMAGFMTTFTYAVWTLLAEYLGRAPFGSRFHHHVRTALTRSHAR